MYNLYSHTKGPKAIRVSYHSQWDGFRLEFDEVDEQREIQIDGDIDE